MTVGISGVCFLVGVILLILATVGVPSGRFSLLAAGLTFVAAGHFFA